MRTNPSVDKMQTDMTPTHMKHRRCTPSRLIKLACRDCRPGTSVVGSVVRPVQEYGIVDLRRFRAPWRLCQAFAAASIEAAPLALLVLTYVQLDGSRRRARKLQLLSGRSLVSYTQVTSVAGCTEFNVTVARAYSKLLGLQGKRHARRRHELEPRHSSRRHLIPGIAVQTARQYPSSCKRLCRASHFLQVMAGTYDSTFRNMRLTKNMYEGSSFMPVERVPRCP